MHPSLHETSHRPWPLPYRPWLMRQTWSDLAFIHWAIDVDVLRGYIPDRLEIDTFGGQAWIGIVPFDMSDIAPRGLPSIPAISDFPEINVRTYVKYGGKAGVWFFSLDVPNPLAVVVARLAFHLPYNLARVELERRGRDIGYRAAYSARRFEALYGPELSRTVGDPRFAHWATERYCLYSGDGRGRLFRGEIHHRPWNAVPAKLEIVENSFLRDLSVREQHPDVLFSERIEVVVWPLEELE